MSRTAVINNKFIPSDFLPIGFLGYLPYSAAPAGWLVCDGTVYNVADYPELAAKLGSTYGGDGVSTFAVPDDRGLFRRGLDLGKGYDSGRVLGSEQGDAFQGHKHNWGASGAGTASGQTLGDYSAGGSYAVPWQPYSGGMLQSQYWQLISDGGNGTPRAAAETRPKNRAYVPIIKAKNIYYDMTVQGGNAASLGGNPASYYTANSQAVKYTDFTGTFAASGYRKLPDGTVLQWGSVTTAGALCSVAFPVAFTVATYSIVLSPCINSATLWGASIGAASPSGFSFYPVAYNNTLGSLPYYWQAIGK